MHSQHTILQDSGQEKKESIRSAVLPVVEDKKIDPTKTYFKAEPMILNDFKGSGIHKIFQGKKQPKESTNPESKRNDKLWFIKKLRKYQFSFSQPKDTKDTLEGRFFLEYNSELNTLRFHVTDKTMQAHPISCTLSSHELSIIGGVKKPAFISALKNKSIEQLQPFLPKFVEMTAEKGFTQKTLAESENVFYTEYLAGEFHRMMYCDQAFNVQPKTRLYKDKMGALHLMSSAIEIKAASTFQDFIAKEAKLGNIKHLGSLTTIAWILADRDKHKKNWGIVEENETITAATFDYGFALAAEDDDLYFVLTPSQYELFPFIPLNRKYRDYIRHGFDEIITESVAKLPQIVYEKVKMTLQFLTMPDNFLRRFVESYIDDKEKVEYFTNRLIKRNKAMLVAEDVLDFQEYVISNRSKLDLDKFIEGLKKFKTLGKNGLFENEQVEKESIEAIWSRYNDIVDRANEKISRTTFYKLLSGGIKEFSLEKNYHEISKVLTKYPAISLELKDSSGHSVRDVLVKSIFNSGKFVMLKKSEFIELLTALKSSKNGVRDFFKADVMCYLLLPMSGHLIGAARDLIFADLNELSKIDLRSEHEGCASVTQLIGDTITLNRKDILCNIIQYDKDLLNFFDHSMNGTSAFWFLNFPNVGMMEIFLASGARLDIPDKDNNLILNTVDENTKALVITIMLEQYLKKYPVNPLSATLMKIIDDAKKTDSDDWVKVLDSIFDLAKKYSADQTKPGFFINKEIPKELSWFASKEKLFEELEKDRYQNQKPMKKEVSEYKHNVYRC